MHGGTFSLGPPATNPAAKHCARRVGIHEPLTEPGHLWNGKWLCTFSNQIESAFWTLDAPDECLVWGRYERLLTRGGKSELPETAALHLQITMSP
jgi:hypothetical protein